jgi:uncharacterized protein (TIGR02444 family)
MGKAFRPVNWKVLRISQMSSETEKRLYLPDNLELDNPFWTFSLDVWRSPKVREGLLACQDEHALRVSQLLFAAWLANQGRLLQSTPVDEIPGLAEWQHQMVDGLRSCRRQLPLSGQACDTLKQNIQRAELLAEQLEMGWLYARHKLLSKAAKIDEDVLMVNFIYYTREALGVAPLAPLPAKAMKQLQSLVASFGHLTL